MRDLDELFETLKRSQSRSRFRLRNGEAAYPREEGFAVVPHNQSEILLDALKKAGVEATLYTVQGGGHGGFKDPQVDVLVAQFFEQHLRR